jgi:biotin-dependent carboxylase-like uncharacterized protein
MTLTVVDPGALSTVQDQGRVGRAHLGVPRAGALDAPAAALANRIVGNDAEAAVVETTLTGIVLRADVGHWLAVTGAPCAVSVDGHAAPHAQAVWAEGGSVVTVGPARSGVRSYVAVAGGIAVEPVLGSRSTDTLAWVGPPPLDEGTVLPVGAASGQPRAHDTPRPPGTGPLRVVAGPRAAWLDGDALARLCSSEWTVGEASNRIGLRLGGPSLARSRTDELPSEGIVLGAVQVPTDGQPVVFLADHPVTGGYPVAAVVVPEDLPRCAQARPGDVVRFTPARG